MAERVCVTGGSGFVGSATIAELRRRGFEVSALVNSRAISTSDAGIRSISGGLFNPDALRMAIEGCFAVLHLVGIIMENPRAGITFEHIHVDGARCVIAGARSAGVQRLVYLSAAGARDDPAASRYHRTKFAAEQAVRDSGLAWTILQPSLIHGPGGELTAREANWARKREMPFLFMPYFGRGWLGLGGGGRVQPVYVRDVARALVDSIGNPAAVGKTYQLGGPAALSWPQLHQAMALAVVGHRRWIIPVPASLARAAASVGLGPLLGFNADQVMMGLEDNLADSADFARDFGWSPQRLEPALAQYADTL